ncbi:hypothetical protein IC762_18095 [Bradyrhizobium genosp. L]|uniref:hypothetical protein n=1 Tax=Bradyrhizobium genosp. L TaxID=83637 RepID=UPI0018A3106C|nr:hypothetical protein [Bradyrhizobium genosp. L]QPF81732.1 hypothetical protein IC762_18095 [Bradyrhizobium genosp. L]
MAAAHAGPVQRASDTSTVTSDTRIGCNGSTGWIGAAVPCRNYYKFTNVGECHIKLQSLGWDNNAQAWYCSNLGLKN